LVNWPLAIIQIIASDSSVTECSIPKLNGVKRDLSKRDFLALEHLPKVPLGLPIRLWTFDIECRYDLQHGQID
jgi:hypothetical protein